MAIEVTRLNRSSGGAIVDGVRSLHSHASCRLPPRPLGELMVDFSAFLSSAPPSRPKTSRDFRLTRYPCQCILYPGCRNWPEISLLDSIPASCRTTTTGIRTSRSARRRPWPEYCREASFRRWARYTLWSSCFRGLQALSAPLRPFPPKTKEILEGLPAQHSC